MYIVRGAFRGGRGKIGWLPRSANMDTRARPSVLSVLNGRSTADVSALRIIVSIAVGKLRTAIGSAGCLTGACWVSHSARSDDGERPTIKFAVAVVVAKIHVINISRPMVRIAGIIDRCEEEGRRPCYGV